MTQFRIATNGIEFRVEYQTFTFWRNREVWEPLREPGGPMAPGPPMIPFATYEEADAEMKKQQLLQQRYNGTWGPVHV